jgi:hypothetical protein
MPGEAGPSRFWNMLRMSAVASTGAGGGPPAAGARGSGVASWRPRTKKPRCGLASISPWACNWS